jgi:hypothetical protein
MLPETLRARSRNQPQRSRSERLGRREGGGDGQAAGGTKAAGMCAGVVADFGPKVSVPASGAEVEAAGSAMSTCCEPTAVTAPIAATTPTAATAVTKPTMGPHCARSSSAN